MPKPRENHDRPVLKIALEEAQKLVKQQIDRGRAVPNESVNENEEARQWYDYTEELLIRICSTDKLSDEFTGKGSYDFSDDISTSHFLRKLESIYKRLELYQSAELHAKPSPSPTPISVVTQIARRFHAVARQLRKRYNQRTPLEIEDEYDAQDLMRALLFLQFDDVRTEEWTPSYASGSSRMDFLLKSERIVVEIKKTRNGLEARDVADQLIIDIARYKSHPDCKALVCLIYDPEERIANPAGIENDLTRVVEGLDVRIIVTQK